MHFNNPIPRSGLPTFHESSSQRSLRDSDVTPRVWQKTATQGQQLYKACQAIEQLQRQINRLRLRKGAGPSTSTYYPFKIYQSPPNPALDTAGHIDKDWRTFRVHSGQVGLDVVDCTDGITNPDDQTAATPDFLTANPATPTGIDFLLNSGSVSYVYIDANGLPLVVHMDDATTLPTTPIDISTWNQTTGWDDGYFILLGWVDCTDTTNKVAKVRQLVRADLPEYIKTKVCVAGVSYDIMLPGRIV